MAKLFTVREAAALLSVKDNTLRHWMFQNKIEFVRVGSRSVRFTQEQIDSMLSVQAVRA